MGGLLYLIIYYFILIIYIYLRFVVPGLHPEHYVREILIQIIIIINFILIFILYFIFRNWNIYYTLSIIPSILILLQIGWTRTRRTIRRRRAAIAKEMDQ